MPMIENKKLDFWASQGLNVLFKGRHGVGKTSMVIAAFERANLTWQYFSAATMDPWVDFIGVPKEAEDVNGPYLDLVLPKSFRNDEVEALFFDEFNRSHKKVRNAVMELIQFKSINGRPFKNLKMVWAAINPDDEDDTYDVERLDPAQLDRFHVHIEIPYVLAMPYFAQKFTAPIARIANEWWTALPVETRDDISPRRLDYALDHFGNQGDLRDILPDSANVSALMDRLEKHSIQKVLTDFMNRNDIAGAKVWMKDSNNLAALMPYIEDTRGNWPEKLTLGGRNSVWDFFLPLLESERFSAIYYADSDIRRYVLQRLDKEFADFLKDKDPLKLAADSGVTFHSEQSAYTVKPTRWMESLPVWNEQIAAAHASSRKSEILAVMNRCMPHDLKQAQIEATFSTLDKLARRNMPTTLRRYEFKSILAMTNTLIALYNAQATRNWRYLAPILYKRLHAAFPQQVYVPPR